MWTWSVPIQTQKQTNKQNIYTAIGGNLNMDELFQYIKEQPQHFKHNCTVVSFF